MPSHLGGFTSKSNKCESHKSRLLSSAQGLLCSLVLSSIHSLNPTQEYTLITQYHKERLGRAQLWLPSFLGRPAINRMEPGTAAHQGGG